MKQQKAFGYCVLSLGQRRYKGSKSILFTQVYYTGKTNIHYSVEALFGLEARIGEKRK